MKFCKKQVILTSDHAILGYGLKGRFCNATIANSTMAATVMTSGIDGVTAQEHEVILVENLSDSAEKMKGKRYSPQPMRRVYIPKPEGSQRESERMIVEGKTVLMGMEKILFG
jgi:RNA-directed DNA polymerase